MGLDLGPELGGCGDRSYARIWINAGLIMIMKVAICSPSHGELASSTSIRLYPLKRCRISQTICLNAVGCVILKPHFLSHCLCIYYPLLHACMTSTPNRPIPEFSAQVLLLMSFHPEASESATIPRRKGHHKSLPDLASRATTPPCTECMRRPPLKEVINERRRRHRLSSRYRSRNSCDHPR